MVVVLAGIPLFAVAAIRDGVRAATSARDQPPLIARTARVVTLVSVPGVLLETALTPVVLPLLFRRESAPAVPVAQVLLLAVLAGTTSRLVASALLTVGEPGLRSRLQLVATAVVVLLLALVPPFGVMGAATVYWSSRCLAPVLCNRHSSRIAGLRQRDSLVAHREDVAFLRQVLRAVLRRGSCLPRRRAALQEALRNTTLGRETSRPEEEYQLTSTGVQSTLGGRTPSARFASLDGLRGVAAVVVLVFHVMLVSPVWDAADEAEGTDLDGWGWVLAHTPVHIFWLGPTAVFVFFVLSGFVLALPVAAGRIRWRSYYPKRVIRLYLPVWGSLVLAVLLARLFPRQEDPTRSDWFNAHADLAGFGEVARDALLVTGTGWLNSPLWSLRWEVLFSLLLPLYVLGALVLQRLWVAKLVAVLVLIGALRVFAVDAAFYLSMFALGVLLAFHREQLAGAAAWLSARPRAVWPGLGALCVLLLTARPILLGIGPLDDLERGVARALQLTGAVLAVFLALHWPAARRLLTSRGVQWVGTRSFSLYLIHEPIVVSLAVALPSVGVGGLLVLALPLSLLAAHTFYRLVEKPSQRLATRAGGVLGPRSPDPVG